MVLLVAALALAEAWKGVAERFSSTGARCLAWGAVLVIPMAELTGVPFHRFDYEPPAFYSQLAEDSAVESIMDCPPMLSDIENARYVYFQTTHEKKQPLGYCTILSKGKRQADLMTGIVNTY